MTPDAPPRDEPTHSSGERRAARARGALFDDGLVWLDDTGGVADVNDEAARLLGTEPGETSGSPLESLGNGTDGWPALVQAAREGRRTDVALRAADGTRLLGSTRREVGDPSVTLVVLRDLDAFDYRRDRALGTPHDARLRGRPERRPRPDYAVQRRLSSTLHRVLTRGERAIAHGARVLIRGESGVGKGEIARHLHGCVADATDPFVAFHCAAHPAAKHEPLLFGRTGGDRDGEPGLVAAARGGTLFVDELGELHPVAQARLLGFLDDGGEAHALAPGGRRPRSVEPRVIAATNRDGRALIGAGRLRADLYHRLAVVELVVPPLRDVPELIGHLATRFLRLINQRREAPLLLPPRLLEALEDQGFPGNVRELQNLVQRAAIFVDDADDLDSLIAELLEPPSGVPDGAPVQGSPGDAGPAPVFDLRTEMRRHERALIDRAIRLHGSKRRAAVALGVDIATVSRKTAARTPRSSPSEASGRPTKKEVTPR